MTTLLKLSVPALAALLTGCATYESAPVQRTTVTEYSHGPVNYYSAPPVYYTAPAPVYIAPPVYVAPPIYVAPAPAFSMQLHSGPSLRKDPPSHGRGRHRLRGGNAADAQIGGPGWSGSVWSR